MPPHRYYRWLFLCCLLLLHAPVLVFAQQVTLRGFVTDASTEQPLQGATVALRTGDALVAGTSTDADGVFLVNRIAPGTYTLQISFVGFAAYEETLTLQGGITERSVALEPQLGTIDELVVEAEGETGVTAVAAGLQTIAAVQIERVPMPGVTGDLASYLQTLPGIVTTGDRGGQFFVRGGAVDQNLALIDGLPIYQPFHLLSFYSAFPEEIINDVDVYTGGYGARYSTRISSMLDVRTRNGNKQDLAGAFSIAPFLSTLRVEGPLIPGRVSFVGSVRQSLVEDIMPNLFGQDFPYRFGDQFAKVHGFLGSQHSLSATVLNTFDRGDVAGSNKDFRGEITESIATDSNQVAWDNFVVGGRYQFRANRLPLLAELTGGYSEMTSSLGPEDTPERTAEVQSVDVAGHVTVFMGRHTLAFGSRYRRTDLAYELGGLFQDVESNAEDVAELNSYASLVLGFGRVQIEPGVNVYQLPERGDAWIEPRLRASARVGGQSFHAAWGLYHQVIVGLNDERDIGSLFTAWRVVPEGTDVPEAMHAIAGWSGTVAPGISLAAEGFYKRYTNLAVPIFSAFPQFTTTLQSADGTAYGGDFRVEWAARPFLNESMLDGYVSYALSQVEYETTTVTYTPAHDRRHQLSALLHAQKDDLGLTLQWQFGSGLPFTPSGGFDVWHLLTPDVDVARQPGTERILYAEPFSARQPTYQRLDVWLERRVEQGRYVGTLRVGALNLFNRDNLFYFDLFTMSRVDQLPFVPSVGFKVELR